jgi:hypothetical protein
MSAPIRTPTPRLFPLGEIVTTTGVIKAVSTAQIIGCLLRHVSGDFGLVCAEDAELNRLAIKNGKRVFSAYAIDPAKPAEGHGENAFWIITEADRSATTFLLPDEY